MKTKKLAILSERLPYPPTSGTKNLLYHYCKILHESLGFEVVNLSFLENDDDVSLKPEFIAKTYPISSPSNNARLKNLIVKTFLKREFPMQVSLFWDQSLKKKIDCILDFEKPDYVIADFIRTAEYLKDYPGFKILDMQDLLSLRYERQMKLDLSSFNPYGAFLYRMPYIFQKVMQGENIKNLVLSNEIRLLKKYETNISDYYNRVMFVARHEGDLLDQRIMGKKSVIVPLGVDIDYFGENLHIEKEKHTIAFLGALSVAHNENGIIHFIKDIFPLIQEKVPDAKLYIIGGGATKQIKSAVTDNVILTGRVDDIRKYVEKCQVFVCPLTFGSGIKTKNLEAMAMGIPIVTTPIGAENIDAPNDVWKIANDNQEFANYVVEIMEDKDLYRKLQINEKIFVEKNFTWKLAEKQLKKLFQ